MKCQPTRYKCAFNNFSKNKIEAKNKLQQMDLKLKKIDVDKDTFLSKMDSEIFSKVEMPFFRKCFYSSLNSDNILIYREKVSINENITRILENEFGKIIKTIR